MSHKRCLLNSTISSLLHEAFVFVCNTFAVMQVIDNIRYLSKQRLQSTWWPPKFAKIFFMPELLTNTDRFSKQEAFEKCWAHSPLRAAARCLFYIAIHQVSLLSHAACASMSTTMTTTTTTTRDRGDRYGPIEWAQLFLCQNQEKILSLRIQPYLTCVAMLPCNAKCLKSNSRKEDDFCNNTL